MATTKKASKKASTKQQNVYYFGAGKCDGDGSMKALLGGKGANLAEMSSIGVPVPAGFTITTEVATYFLLHLPSDYSGHPLDGVLSHLQPGLSSRD